MSQTLADLMPSDGNRAGIRMWLKSSAYTRRLLLGESGDPWESAAQYLAYFSQAHGLLKPDVAVIEVGELFASWLQRHPAVRAELAGKRKLSYPLRKLLEQAQPRALLAEIIEAALANLRGQAPLVLAMPSPRDWLLQANREAGREEAEADADGIEDAAMYMADLVRSVSASAVGGILLEEPQHGHAGAVVDVALYRPLLNVARHYRWPLALRLGEGEVVDSDALADIDMFIGAGSAPARGSAHGLDVSASLWAGQPLPDLGPTQFYFIEIPRNAAPEQVLDSLSKLRAGGL